jgi:DNA-binding PadR family transcriptional regulator
VSAVLELAILGLLKEQDLHGYELKKRLSDRLGFASGVSFGSLYPALRRLERAEAVTVVDSSEAAGVAIPFTGSLGGELAAYRARKASGRGSRGKKVYRLTARGEQLFEELLAAEHNSSEDDRVFSLRLMFARHLAPDARLGMLERRRAHLMERLNHLRARLKAGRERGDGYTHSLIEHDREAVELDLTWIDRLIATERAETPVAARADEVGPAGPPSSGVPIAESVDERREARPAQSPIATRVYAPTISGLRPLSPQEGNIS